MKKFLAFLMLVMAMQFANGQCTAFLGPDKQFMPCSNPFALNTDSIFHEPPTTTFQQQNLPPFDTIFAVGGGQDTLVPLTIKVMYTATRADGCTDVCIVGVAIRRWPIPDLGPDTCLNLGFQKETMDINSIFINKITFISGYNHHIWSTPTTPTDVDTGFYWVKVVTHDGCSDVLNICVRCAVIRDTVVKKCDGDKYNLTTLFVKSGYTNLWKRIRFPQGDTIVYPTPAAADTGRYLLFSSKPGRCTDTMFVKVENYPRLDLGPDRNEKKCFGSTIDLTQLFLLTGIQTNWTKNGAVVPDPTKAGPATGTFRLIGTNLDGCKDTVFITVTDNPKPEIGDNKETTICPTDEPVNLNAVFDLTGLVGEWTTPNPSAVQEAGTYRLIAHNSFGCTDTAFYKIMHYVKPAFLVDTVIHLCFGHTKDLNTIYTIPAGYSLVDWSTTTPAVAGAGNYIITVGENFTGCKFSAVVTLIQDPASPDHLQLCTYDIASTGGVFTTNFFRTVTIDKRGHVWAGSEDGGLYRFTPLVGTACGGTWQKNVPSSGIKAGINRYKDLYASIIVGDTSIWAASQGYDHPRDLTGGIDHVLNLNAPLEHYGSVNVPQSTEIGSRNVNSFALGNSGKIYAALGQSLTNDSTASIILEGGVYYKNMDSASTPFTKFLPGLPLNDIRVTAAGNRSQNKIWFAVDKACNTISGGCTEPYMFEIKDTSMLVTQYITTSNSVIPFNRPGLLIRAIFTASDGRTYVGLNDSVGIAVLEPEAEGTTPLWTLVNTDNSPLPYNAGVNFNAITEVNGEIWIGTNRGLMIYDGIGSLTECASWKLYTTAQGLPSNNVTDIAYSQSSFDVWLTTSAGVSKIVFNPSISGTIQNAFIGPHDSLKNTIQVTPIEDALVELELMDGTQIANVTTGVSGNFDFPQVLPGKKYKLKVFVNGKSGNVFNYTYNDLNFNNILGNILIPDSLAIEIDSMKSKLEKHKFEFGDLGIDTLLGVDEFLRVTDGFEVAGLKDPAFYYSTHNIQGNYVKRVENMANYYQALSTIYLIGLKGSELKKEQYKDFFDILDALAEIFGIELELKKLPKIGGIDSEVLEKTLGAAGEKLAALFSAALDWALTYAASKTPSWENDINKYKPRFIAAFDFMFKTAVSGSTDAIKEKLKESLVESLIVLLTKEDYKDFCRELHKGLVASLSSQAIALGNDKKYDVAYKSTYSIDSLLNPKSIYRQAIDTAASYKESSETARKIGEVSDGIGTVAEIGSELTLAVGAVLSLTVVGAPVGAVLIEISQGLDKIKKATELFKPIPLLASAFYNHQGNMELKKLSLQVRNVSGFSYLTNLKRDSKTAFLTAAVLDSLTARKNRLNLALNQLKPLFGVTFDSANYYTKLRSVVSADSLFTSELRNVLNELWPKAAPAMQSISGFTPKYDLAIDSIHRKEQTISSSMFYNNAIYQLNKQHPGIAGNMDTTITNLVFYNDLLVAKLDELFTDINTNNIQTGAFLANTNTVTIYNGQPGATATVTYTIKNTGNVTASNVAYLMGQPVGGLVVTSPAYITLGNIAPGQTKQFSYNFTAPQIDTISSFTIKAFADNGYYTDLNGYFSTLLPTEVFSVANGLWSNPATWSTHRVPNANSVVTVRHNVDIDISTAECKSIRAVSPGMLKVKAGIKFSVKK